MLSFLEVLNCDAEVTRGLNEDIMKERTKTWLWSEPNKHRLCPPSTRMSWLYEELEVIVLSDPKTGKFRNQADCAMYSLWPGPMSMSPNSILSWAASAICQHPCVSISLPPVLSLSPVWSNPQDLCWTYRWFYLYLISNNWKYFRKPVSRERAWEPGSSTPLIHNKLCSDNLLKGGRIIWRALVT